LGVQFLGLGSGNQGTGGITGRFGRLKDGLGNSGGGLGGIEFLFRDGPGGSLGKGLRPIEILGGLVGVCLLSVDLRLSLDELCLGLPALSAGAIEPGPGLLAADLELAGIDPRQRIPGLDALVLFHEDFGDRSRHPGADLVDVRGNIGVVGGRPGAGIFPPAICAVESNAGDHRQEQRQGEAGARGRAGGARIQAWFDVVGKRIIQLFDWVRLRLGSAACGVAFCAERSVLRVSGAGILVDRGLNYIHAAYLLPRGEAERPIHCGLVRPYTAVMMEAMELRHLRYFVAVAEDLNFTRAAARLHLAQPALSSQVKDLESELETRLFERGHSGVQLTRAGKALFKRARGILTQVAEAANEARTAGGTITGTLVLGFPSGLHLNFLAPAIAAFRRAQPQIEFEYYHGLPVQLLKALREGRIDLAFIFLPASVDGLEVQPIWRVPFEVALPRGHGLAKRASFELADLRNEDFVFSTREARPDFYDEFFRQCANAGFRPRVVKEVGGYPTNILGLISVGLGLAVLPHFDRAERMTGILWRPLTKPKLWIDSALIWRRQGVSRVVEQFLATAQEEFPLPPTELEAWPG
jgi:LysR family transcriptional regulator, benzoate and cis,cis-muconate-responsive activator of ben and cat genes